MDRDSYPSSLPIYVVKWMLICVHRTWSFLHTKLCVPYDQLDYTIIIQYREISRHRNPPNCMGIDETVSSCVDESFQNCSYKVHHWNQDGIRSNSKMTLQTFLLHNLYRFLWLVTIPAPPTFQLQQNLHSYKKWCFECIMYLCRVLSTLCKYYVHSQR